MVISEKEISSFEEELYHLEESIRTFDDKVSRSNLSGIINLTHKMESDLEKLDSELSRIVEAETTSIEQIRNIRLNDNLDELKKRYNNIKVKFENGVIIV